MRPTQTVIAKARQKTGTRNEALFGLEDCIRPTFEIADPYRTVTTFAGEYQFKRSIFSVTTMDHYPYRNGLLIEISDGVTENPMLLIQDQMLSSMMDSDITKEKAIIRFAQANFETFAKIVDDLNQASIYSEDRMVPYNSTEDAFSIGVSGERIYIYD